MLKIALADISPAVLRKFVFELTQDGFNVMTDHVAPVHVHMVALVGPQMLFIPAGYTVAKCAINNSSNGGFRATIVAGGPATLKEMESQRVRSQVGACGHTSSQRVRSQVGACFGR